MEFCNKVDDLPHISSLTQSFTAVISEFGFSRFSIERFLQSDHERRTSASIARNWPRSWVDHYVNEKYFSHDRVAHFAYTQIRPWTWAEIKSQIPSTPKLVQMEAEIAEIGIVDGLVLALHDSSSLQGIMSLGAERPVTISAWERKLLHMVCLHAQIRATEFRDSQRRALPQLSDREREVLKWVAIGKTLWETSTILAIGEDTVAKHTRSAREKLGASTTTQAVVQAMRTKQISIG
jgi:LuxR family quorum sensing-dependent transcriptional regulator